MQQREAITRIAEWTGETITPAGAARILIEAGLSKATPPGVTSQAQRILSASDRFERVRLGTYRLRDRAEPATMPGAEDEPADGSTSEMAPTT